MARVEALTRRILLCWVLCGAMTVPALPASAAERVTIFAAASLKTALDPIAQLWQSRTGQTASISYAASSALARQIEQGAPADLFMSADLDWMDYLATRNLVALDTRVELLGNRLVLIAPKGTARSLEIAPPFDLAAHLGSGRLAMGNVAAVPAGKYGKAALEAVGAWDGVSNRLAQADNVRAALLLVARGEAVMGIVYATDARAEPGVDVVATFPAKSHPPIVYPVALTLAGAKRDEAQDFLRLLKSAQARAAFEAQGFAWISAP